MTHSLCHCRGSGVETPLPNHSGKMATSSSPGGNPFSRNTLQVTEPMPLEGMVQIVLGAKNFNMNLDKPMPGLDTNHKVGVQLHHR